MPRDLFHPCNNPACEKVSALICGGCRAYAFCSAECHAAEWRAHKATCRRLAKDKAEHGRSPLLEALEVALWGRVSEGDVSRRERSRRLEEWAVPAHFLEHWQEHSSLAPVDCAFLLSVVALPPVVQLPDGRYCAFVPSVFLGVFTSLQTALRAVALSGGRDDAALTLAPLNFGVHGHSLLLPGAPERLSCMAQLASARGGAARHCRPLQASTPSTTPDYYKARMRRVLPAPATTLPDAFYVYPLRNDWNGELMQARRTHTGSYLNALPRAEPPREYAAQALYDAAERALFASAPLELHGGGFDSLLAVAASSSAASFAHHMMAHIYPESTSTTPVSIRFSPGSFTLPQGALPPALPDTAQNIQNNGVFALTECIGDVFPTLGPRLIVASGVVTASNASAANFAVIAMSCFDTVSHEV